MFPRYSKKWTVQLNSLPISLHHSYSLSLSGVTTVKMFALKTDYSWRMFGILANGNRQSKTTNVESCGKQWWGKQQFWYQSDKYWKWLTEKSSFKKGDHGEKKPLNFFLFLFIAFGDYFSGSIFWKAIISLKFWPAFEQIIIIARQFTRGFYMLFIM